MRYSLSAYIVSWDIKASYLLFFFGFCLYLIFSSLSIVYTEMFHHTTQSHGRAAVYRVGVPELTRVPPTCNEPGGDTIFSLVLNSYITFSSSITIKSTFTQQRVCFKYWSRYVGYTPMKTFCSSWFLKLFCWLITIRRHSAENSLSRVTI